MQAVQVLERLSVALFSPFDRLGLGKPGCLSLFSVGQIE